MVSDLVAVEAYIGLQGQMAEGHLWRRQCRNTCRERGKCTVDLAQLNSKGSDCEKGGNVSATLPGGG